MKQLCKKTEPQNMSEIDEFHDAQRDGEQQRRQPVSDRCLPFAPYIAPQERISDDPEIGKDRIFWGASGIKVSDTLQISELVYGQPYPNAEKKRMKEAFQ